VARVAEQHQGAPLRQTPAQTLDDRERALHAARQVLLRSGFHGFKLQAVLAASGLSTRAFYRQFADKYDLLRVLIEDHYAALTERSRQVLQSSATPMEALSEWLDLMLDLESDEALLAQEAAFIRHWEDVCAAYPDSIDSALSGLHQALADVLANIRVSGSPFLRPSYDAAALLLLTRSAARQRLTRRPNMSLSEARAIVWPFAFRSLMLRVELSDNAQSE
jgi:AcrR family transcriptional regulator